MAARVKVLQKPTVQRLIRLLEETPVRVVKRISDGSRGYWDRRRGLIVVSIASQPERADGLVATVIHELLHKWFEVDHDDTANRHEHVWPGELELFRSRALRERVMRRLLNSALYNMQTEWRQVEETVSEETGGSSETGGGAE